MFDFHCRELGLDITYRLGESFQCILNACRAHTVQVNISVLGRQAGKRSANSFSLAKLCGLRLLFLAEFLETRIGAQGIPERVEPKKGRRNGRWVVKPAAI